MYRFLVDEKSQAFRVAAQIIFDHCCIDDLALYFPSATLEKKQNIVTILKSGNFIVKGYHSNFSQVDEFPETIETEIFNHRWFNSTDNFRPNFVETVQKTITNRSILFTKSNLWDLTQEFLLR